MPFFFLIKNPVTFGWVITSYKEKQNLDLPKKTKSNKSQILTTSPTALKTTSKTRKHIKALAIYEPGEYSPARLSCSDDPAAMSCST